MPLMSRMRPLRGLQETRVATREESGVFGFPSLESLSGRLEPEGCHQGVIVSVMVFFFSVFYDALTFLGFADLGRDCCSQG